jgi:MFS transporter, OFA family, oxalate/formate antiporter
MSTVRRWPIPLGAVLVHLGIGSVYAWSTLNRPIVAALPGLPWWATPPYPTFTTALVMLGLSAATLGPWVEMYGARVAARTSALLFASGLLVGAAALQWQQPVLLFLGLGLLCGIGCGIGYIAPVSTLVKWFPDRRGMATGLAIMGFGGGAFLAGYANPWLITRVGVAGTLALLAAAYLTLMLLGAQLLRAAPGHEPRGRLTVTLESRIVADSHTRHEAIRTPQFALLWGMLCINVTAGIGILAQASPMTQDLFGKTPAEAAGVVALISVFNAGGRIVWSSVSDLIGRKRTYLTFFAVQANEGVGFRSWPVCSSSSRCMAVASRRFQRFSRISLAPPMSARFMARCSPPGVWQRLSGRWSLPNSLPAPAQRSPPARARCTSTISRSAFWPHCWRLDSC